jgi:hypothetical protein
LGVLAGPEIASAMGARAAERAKGFEASAAAERVLSRYRALSSRHHAMARG